MTNLNKYKWGFGIEHEMHIFHIPKDSKSNIKDFILFNSHDIIQKILNNMNNSKNLSYDDYELLKNIPFEKSGRICNGEWVIKPAPILMPELITNSPFCSIKDDRNFKIMVEEIISYRKRLFNILMKDDNTKRLVEKYGQLAQYPYGMTRYLKCPITNKNGIYIFEKELVPEYNGSYHITMTLPYTEETTNKEFIKMHMNFCNQLQWLEPLLLTAYFSGDESAPGCLKKVRGSFRVMIIGWGNLAGTDIRLLNKGIGRYAKTKNYWRKNLKFDDSAKLKPCYKPSILAQKEGAISSLSSDFRTFGPNNNNPSERVSGAPMSKPNGVEFRIFDHFNDQYLLHLVELIGLVAENSRVTQTKGYVYQNKYWIEALHSIMKYGWKAELSKKYIGLLRRKLGLKIKTSSIIAIDIFQKIFSELIKKNIDGDWSKIFHCNIKDKFFEEKILSPGINRKAWIFAFMVKINRDTNLALKFKQLNKLTYNLIFSFKKFEKLVLKIFGRNWKNDVIDIAYFYEFVLSWAKIIKNKNGTIKEIIFFDKRLQNISNFNEYIINQFEKF